MSNSKLDEKTLKSLKRWASVGLGFAIVWLLIYTFLLLGLVALLFVTIEASMKFGYGYNIEGVIASVGITISFVITIMLLIRINRLRIAINKGDLVAVKKLDSLLWGILAILFLGIIGGFALIALHRELPKISSETPKPPEIR